MGVPDSANDVRNQRGLTTLYTNQAAAHRRCPRNPPTTESISSDFLPRGFSLRSPREIPTHWSVWRTCRHPLTRPPRARDDARAMTTPPKNPQSADPSSDEAFLDRPLEEVLGLKLKFLPDQLAPPVDEQRLRAFLRHELPRDEAREVLSFTLRFRTWHEALARAVRERSASD